MQDVVRNQLEEEVRGLCERDELRLAVERVVRGYGPHVRRLMAAVLQNETRVEDAFGFFCERLVKGLPGFRWDSSLRTWLQKIARNACFTQVNAAAVRHPHVELSSAPEPPECQRSSTNPWQRTSMKEHFRALRAQLEPEDQRLLELHVDQQLPWPEVVRCLTPAGTPVTGEARARRAAALRQQYQRIKSRLRSLAEQEGVLCRE